MLSDGNSENSFQDGSSGKTGDAAQRAKDIAEHEDEIMYSARYSDDHHEYRHVNLPREIARWVPQGRLMIEQEWRSLGVKQSPGWYHYMLHAPEPHILLFKRDK
ncbi:cyclin-dependent kinase regulatory subunit-domain-containing protein [Chytriomyces sp. MP71]|nr:cyclin-dependent kinase regulatory subunit-domain-containing protein [Chytriomyces sp. MP71]